MSLTVPVLLISSLTTCVARPVISPSPLKFRGGFSAVRILSLSGVSALHAELPDVMPMRTARIVVNKKKAGFLMICPPSFIPVVQNLAERCQAERSDMADMGSDTIFPV